MKKFTIIVISLFMVLLISLSSVGEAMGTSSKYASNQDYIQSENLALKDKSNKMTDGKDSSVYRFKTRNGGEAVIDLGESCDFNTIILKEKGLNVQKFSISVSDDNESFTQIYANDKIEFHRLCTFDTVKARRPNPYAAPNWFPEFPGWPSHFPAKAPCSARLPFPSAIRPQGR